MYRVACDNKWVCKYTLKMINCFFPFLWLVTMANTLSFCGFNLAAFQKQPASNHCNNANECDWLQHSLIRVGKNPVISFKKWNIKQIMDAFTIFKNLLSKYQKSIQWGYLDRLTILDFQQYKKQTFNKRVFIFC